MPALGPAPYRTPSRNPHRRTVRPGVPGPWVVVGLVSVMVLLASTLFVLHDIFDNRRSAPVDRYAAPPTSQAPASLRR